MQTALGPRWLIPWQQKLAVMSSVLWDWFGRQKEVEEVLEVRESVAREKSLKSQCMKLWMGSLRCHGDPSILEISRLSWDLWKESYNMERRSPEWSNACLPVAELEEALPKPLGSHTNVQHETIRFAVCPVRCWCNHPFLCPDSSTLKRECPFHGTVCRRATLVVWQAPQKRKKPRVKTTNNSPPQTSLSPLHLQASGNGGRGSGWERKKEGKARGVEATAPVVTKARTLEERWGRGVRLVQWTLVRSWEWPERGFHFHTDRPLLSEESTEIWQKKLHHGVQ